MPSAAFETNHADYVNYAISAGHGPRSLRQEALSKADKHVTRNPVANRGISTT